MKRAHLILLTLFLPATLFYSCDKLTDDGGDDYSGQVYTDERLLGTWQVTEYEAIDDHNQVFMTESSSSVIYNTFRRFTFDASGNMWIYMGSDKTYDAGYNYYSELALLRFLDTGSAETVTLTTDEYIFRSTWFAPLEWYKTDGSGQLLNDISTVQVTCSKVTEQEDS